MLHADDPEGDLLVVGWGSTKGVIEESVERLRAEGRKVSSLHLRFIQPMPSGIGEILRRFKKVMAVEGTWGDSLKDELIDEEGPEYMALGRTAALRRKAYVQLFAVRVSTMIRARRPDLVTAPFIGDESWVRSKLEARGQAPPG